MTVVIAWKVITLVGLLASMIAGVVATLNGEYDRATLAFVMYLVIRGSSR